MGMIPLDVLEEQKRLGLIEFSDKDDPYLRFLYNTSGFALLESIIKFFWPSHQKMMDD